MTSQWTGFHSPLAAGIEMFLGHKRALGCHLHTIESVLRLLDRFLAEQHVETIEAITPALIEAFLKSRPRTVPRSFNQLLGIVTRLFDWLIARDLMLRSPVQGKPRRTTASRLPFLFDPATARRLLDAAGALPDTRNTPFRGPTYRTIFALLYGLGLRVSEVARLHRGDIDFPHQLLVVRETKFAKSRLVPSGRGSAAWLSTTWSAGHQRTGRRICRSSRFANVSRCRRALLARSFRNSYPNSAWPFPMAPDLPVSTACATRLQ